MDGYTLQRLYLIPKTKKWIVYILELSNGKYYTGITNDIEKRLEKHKAGKGSKIVRSFLPIKALYIELAKNRSEASKREAQIKKMKRSSKKKLTDGK